MDRRAIDRRSFLYRIFKSLWLTAIAAVPYGIGRMLMPEKNQLASLNKSQLNHDKLRPPGALNDDIDFQKACIRCSLCAEVCPPACIQFYHLDDANNANTPYIEPALRACILCGKCMEVCPTNALTVTETRKVNMGRAQIERLACYPWVDRGICGACVSICPLGETAISFEFANMYRPVVNDDCVGCGLCVEVCPHPSLPIRVIKEADAIV